MKNLEHTIRDVIGGKQEVNEENVTIEEIIEEFYSLFDEYEEIDEETFIEVRNVYFNTLYKDLQEDDKNPSSWDLIDYVPVAGAARRAALGDYKTAGILAAADALGAVTGGAGKIAATAAAKAAAKRAAAGALAKRASAKEVLKTVSKTAPKTSATRTAAKKFQKAAAASKEAAGNLALKTGELATLAPKGTAREIAKKALNPFAQGLKTGLAVGAIKGFVPSSLPSTKGSEADTTPSTKGSEADTTPSTKGSEADTTPSTNPKKLSMPGTVKKGEIKRALTQLATGGTVPKQPNTQDVKPVLQQPKTQAVTPAPEQPNAQAVTPAPEQPNTQDVKPVPQQPKTQAVTPAPEQPEPESRKKERWSDVRKRLGFSARQSVTSDPKLLAAYNAYKEGQPIASETEYNQELIEWIVPAAREIGKKLLSKGSKFGKNTIEKLKKLFKGGAKKSGGAARLAGAALTSALLSRLLGGQRGYDHTGQGDQELSTLHSSDIKLHQAGVKEEYILIPEAVEPSDESRKNIEFVPRPNNKRKETEYVGRKKGKKRIDDALGRQASIKSLDV